MIPLLAAIILLDSARAVPAPDISPVRRLPVERRLSERLDPTLAASCPDRHAGERVSVVRVDCADLTGDGREDALVQAVTCAVSFLDVQEVWSLEADGSLAIHPLRDEAAWRLWPELGDGRDTNPLAEIRERTVTVEWEITDVLVPCHPRAGWRRRLEYEWSGDRFALARFVTSRPRAREAGGGGAAGLEVARWPRRGPAVLLVRQGCAGEGSQRVAASRRDGERYREVASLEGSRAWAHLFEWQGRPLLELSSEQLTPRGSWVVTELWAIAANGELAPIRLSGRGACAQDLPEIGPGADAYWGSGSFRFAADGLTFAFPLYASSEDSNPRRIGSVSGTLALEGDELRVASCEREVSSDGDESEGKDEGTGADGAR